MLCKTSLTSGKGLSVQVANVTAGKSGQKFRMQVLLQEMKWQHKELVSRETQSQVSVYMGAGGIKGILKIINPMFYSKNGTVDHMGKCMRKGNPFRPACQLKRQHWKG